MVSWNEVKNIFKEKTVLEELARRIEKDTVGMIPKPKVLEIIPKCVDESDTARDFVSCAFREEPILAAWGDEFLAYIKSFIRMKTREREELEEKERRLSEELERFLERLKK